MLRKRAWLTVGTRRSFDESAGALDSIGDSMSAGEVEGRIGAKTTSTAVHDAEARTREENHRLPFTRMDLDFIDLRYVVTVTEQDDANVKRTLERAQHADASKAHSAQLFLFQLQLPLAQAGHELKRSFHFKIMLLCVARRHEDRCK